MTLHFKPIKASPLIYTGMNSDMSTTSGFSEEKTTGGKSILKMLEQVMLQVEYHCFTDLRFNRTDPLYKELCLIIAEVLVLDQESVVKINGSNISVRLVQEIYSQIQNDHVELVFTNFNNVSHRVLNKKAYLRKYERLYFLRYTPK